MENPWAQEPRIELGRDRSTRMKSSLPRVWQQTRIASDERVALRKDADVALSSRRRSNDSLSTTRRRLGNSRSRPDSSSPVRWRRTIHVRAGLSTALSPLPKRGPKGHETVFAIKVRQ